MTTSANVTEYRIMKDGKQVGNHHENALCKDHFEDLLKFTPASEYTIIPYWYDEEEEYFESKEQNLETFLKKKKVL